MDASVPFGERLLTVAAERSEHPALRYKQESISYGDLFRTALVAGGNLRARGLEPGDRVLVVCEEKLPLLTCHLAAVLAGGVSVPLNPAFTPPELSYFLSDSDARFAIATGGTRDVLEELVAEQSAQCQVLEPHALLDEQGQPLSEPAFRPEQDAFMLYSSGTTGQPKGAMHTHGGLAAAVAALAECWQFVPDDVLLNCLPLYHIHGLSFGCHVALMTGCETIIADRFHPRNTLRQIEEATVFYGVPPFHYSFLERPEFPEAARRWQRLRLITCGSAPIRPEVLPQLEEIVGQPIINRYGMTATHVITSLPLDGPKKQGSVGLPLPGIEMEVRGKEGELTRVDEVGQVWVRGPNLFDRYWQKPEAMRESFDEAGWFATGDLGERDADGLLTLRGRQKDLVIVGGYNVYPPVVERVLNSCPGVRESAVIGVPHPRKGEQVVAVVVRGDAELTESILDAYCRERLVDYQRPTRIVFVEALPRNAMGKVLKRQLRDELG